jgi:hypothetical protein
MFAKMFFIKLRVSHGMVFTIPWPHVIFLDFGWSWSFRWIGLVGFFVGLDWLIFLLDWIGWFLFWIRFNWFGFLGLD